MRSFRGIGTSGFTVLNHYSSNGNFILAQKLEAVCFINLEALYTLPNESEVYIKAHVHKQKLMRSKISKKKKCNHIMLEDNVGLKLSMHRLLNLMDAKRKENIYVCSKDRVQCIYQREDYKKDLDSTLLKFILLSNDFLICKLIKIKIT